MFLFYFGMIKHRSRGVDPGVAERGRHIIILRVHRYLGMERKAEVGSLWVIVTGETPRKEA